MVDDKTAGAMPGATHAQGTIRLDCMFSASSGTQVPHHIHVTASSGVRQNRAGGTALWYNRFSDFLRMRESKELSEVHEHCNARYDMVLHPPPTTPMHSSPTSGNKAMNDPLIARTTFTLQKYLISMSSAVRDNTDICCRRRRVLVLELCGNAYRRCRGAYRFVSFHRIRKLVVVVFQ